MLELWPELSMLATMLALFGQIQIWHHFSVQNLDILFNTLHINSLLMLLSQFAFFFRIQNLKDFTNPQNLDLIERNPIDRIEVALKSFLLIFAAGNKQSRPHFNDISIKRFASRTSNKYTMPWYAQCSLIAYFNAEKLANILCATATCRFDSIWFDGGLCVCVRACLTVLPFPYSVLYILASDLRCLVVPVCSISRFICSKETWQKLCMHITNCWAYSKVELLDNFHRQPSIRTHTQTGNEE